MALDLKKKTGGAAAAAALTTLPAPLAALAAITTEDCWRMHKLFVGTSCIWCGITVPPGPYMQDEYVRFFSKTLWYGSRRVGDVDLANLNNPRSDEELAADAELARARVAMDLARDRWGRTLNEGVRASDSGGGRPAWLPAGAVVMLQRMFTDEARDRDEAARTRRAQAEFDERVRLASEEYEEARRRCARALVRWNEMQRKRAERLTAWRGLNGVAR